MRQVAINSVAFTLALAVACTGVCGAQNGAPPAETQPVIRVTTSEVLLDLTVRDKHGRVVKNLKPGDVQIYEDGVAQQISSLRLVSHRETRRETDPRPEAQNARSLHTVNVVCIVFHNLDPVARRRAVEAAQEFIRTGVPPDAFVGVFNLSDHLTAVYPFTNNRNELLDASRESFVGRPIDFALASEPVLSASPGQVSVTATLDSGGRGAVVTARVTGGEISKTAIVGADVSNSQAANILRGNQVRERGDFSNLVGMRETDKIITMINELGGLPGRKTILLATTGLVTTGDPDRFRKIVESANRQAITVYALDTKGLDEMSTAHAANDGVERVAGVSRGQGAITSSLSEMREKSRQGDNMNDAVRASDVQASLRELSEETGGFLIANTNDYRKAFQRVADDLESRYEATYRPASSKYDGRLRKIEVKLSRPDLHVESRTGYFAMPDLPGSSGLQPFETRALMALGTQPLPHAFNFHFASYHFRDWQSGIALELPGNSLTATPNPERKTHKVHVSWFGLVKDANGEVVDRFSQDSPYEIPDSNLAAVQASSISFTHPVKLPPGQYTVETVFLDQEGARSSAGLFQVASPEEHPGLKMSSLMLVERVEPAKDKPDAADPFLFKGGRLVPSIGALIHPGVKPHTYFVVYPDKSSQDKTKIQVEFLVEGQLAAKQTADLPAQDATGVVPMFVAVPSQTGNCELRITALQGAATASQSVKYTVAAQ